MSLQIPTNVLGKGAVGHLASLALLVLVHTDGSLAGGFGSEVISLLDPNIMKLAPGLVAMTCPLLLPKTPVRTIFARTLSIYVGKRSIYLRAEHVLLKSC